MLQRKQETKAVKEALSRVGYQDITVRHGTGTAWGWLHANITADKPPGCSCVTNYNDYGRVDTCQLCKDARHQANITATDLILEVTGRRRGDYDGNTLVEIELKQQPADTEKPTPEPIPYASKEARQSIRANRAAAANMRITKRNGQPLYY